jgi:hypothetical protein
MIAPGFGSDLDDLVLGEPKVVDPAAHMGSGWRPLPPSGQAGICGKAQRREQLCEKSIKIRIARSCVLLYWFN